MRSLMMVVAGVGMVTFAGCTTSLPANPTQMTADQLREWVKDKNANVTCVVANTPYGKGNAMMLVLDKGIIPNGTVTVDDACKVTVTNGKPEPTQPMVVGTPSGGSSVIVVPTK